MSGVGLVTGGSARIGRAIALELARTGYDIAVHVRTPRAEADALAAEIEGLGRRATVVTGDLADIAAVQALLPAAAAVLGPVTCLVNNASLFEPDDIATMTPQSWDRHHAINLRAPVMLAQAMAAGLPADADGVIVNVIDQRVWRLNPRFLSYTTAKAGLWTLTQTLAQALAPRIRVVAVGPGPTLANSRQSADDFARQSQAVPLQRAASPENVAAAVLYLVGATGVTGQMIAVDGGQHLAWETPDVSGIAE